MYAEWQTELYIPAPVENGVIPKNNYGNIEIFTPSMVPAGGVHIIRPSIALAAQFAGVAYADAVTGFDYVKKKASVRLNGIIVPEGNVEGLLEIWEGMMERVRGEEERLRVTAVLERWRRFFVGMRVRRGLDERHGQVDREDAIEIEENGGDSDGEFLRSAVQDRRDSEIQRPFQRELSISIGAEDNMVRDESFPEASHQLPKVGITTALSSKENNVTTSTSRETVPMDQSDGQDNSFPTTRLHDEADIGEDEDIGGGFMVDDESGHFMQKDDDYEDDDGGGFIYDDEDGLL
jgi:Rad4 beta-hairpin domain 3